MWQTVNISLAWLGWFGPTAMYVCVSRNLSFKIWSSLGLDMVIVAFCFLFQVKDRLVAKLVLRHWGIVARSYKILSRHFSS